jgi:hypothetical protein
MIGERDDVLAAAKQHLVSAHGKTDDSKLDQNLATVVDGHQQATTYSTWF